MFNSPLSLMSKMMNYVIVFAVCSENHRARNSKCGPVALINATIAQANTRGRPLFSEFLQLSQETCCIQLSECQLYFRAAPVLLVCR